MGKADQFDWVVFYGEFAKKLLLFKNNRAELIEKVKRIYEMTGFKMPTLETGNQIVDMDPFTVFGLFNKQLTNANRIRILNAIAELFDIHSPVPQSFDSLPLLNPQNAVFYPFSGERKETDIPELWELFDYALIYAENPSDENRINLAPHFDAAVHIKYNGNSKITMGLYWIAPHAYLNLDQRNTWFIYESGRIPAQIVQQLPVIKARIPSAKYFELVEKLRAYLQSDQSLLKDFKELSFEAWRCSQKGGNPPSQTVPPQDTIGSGLADEDVRTIHYWLYSPGRGASMMEPFSHDGVMGLGWEEIGDLTQYDTREKIIAELQKKKAGRSCKNDSLALWQFCRVMKPGDIVYAKRGRREILARGVVTSDYFYDPEYNAEYPHIRYITWRQGEVLGLENRTPLKTLTDITPYTGLVRSLEEQFGETEEDEDDEEEVLTPVPEYSADQFLKEVYMDRASYETLVGLVRKKKNVILQGAPGVGKTYAAKRLAYSMMGVKDQERIMMVQFHQSYSYEDFIEGFRPTGTGNGFEIKKGAFYLFCRKAADDIEHEYFFIIDEINRGNLSKILGELFMLIENDKRGNALQLLYSDEKFFVPRNVFIIGMMNTADRSLAMLDYALRRRFVFFDMIPGFDSEGFRSYQAGLTSEKFDRLIECTKRLNEEISRDESLGEGFCIGHSYFCNLSEATDAALKAIVEYELAPLLKEYWYDDRTKALDWINRLKDAIR